MTKNLITKIIALSLAVVFTLEVSGYEVKIITKYDSIYYKEKKEQKKITKTNRTIIEIASDDVDRCDNECEKEEGEDLESKKCASLNTRDFYCHSPKIDFTKSPKKKHVRRHHKAAKTKSVKLPDEQQHQSKCIMASETGTLLVPQKLL